MEPFEDDGLLLTDFRGTLVQVEHGVVERSTSLIPYGMSSTADMGFDARCKTAGVPDLFGNGLLFVRLRD